MPATPKTVIVTGAAAGVGRAIAERFARNGARIGLISRDAAALEQLTKYLLLIGASDAGFSAIDVAQADAVEAAAGELEAKLGPCDIWINDAMVTVFSPVSAITAAEYRRVTEVTYLGTVHGCIAALKRMRARKKGHIINIGSALAYRAIPLQSAYCGAKHAIRAFTASLRSEIFHDRLDIAISIIELPAMNTPQFDWGRTHMSFQPRPMGTIYQPEVAAQAVERIVQSRAREYWVGISTVLTIIANTVVPNFMDRYLARNAITGQQTSAPVSQTRRDNLYQSITELHRTHGSFTSDAKNSAIIVSGAITRAAIVLLGGALFFAIGALIFA